MPASTNATFEKIAGYPLSAKDVIRIALDEATGSQVILAAPGAGFKYRVVQLFATACYPKTANADGVTTVQFFSAATPLTGAMELSAGSAGVSSYTSGSQPGMCPLILGFNEMGWFETAENEELKVTTTLDVAGVNGMLGYVKMPV
jgi:hypothetical protein